MHLLGTSQTRPSGCASQLKVKVRFHSQNIDRRNNSAYHSTNGRSSSIKSASQGAK